MSRVSWSTLGRTLSALAALAAFAPTAAHAQYSSSSRPKEITPFGGYQWGGSLDTDAFGTTPSGQLNEQSGFSWGVVFSLPAPYGSAFEMYYLRQSADVRFTPSRGEATNVGTISNNYIQFGGRRDFMAGNKITPFISGSLGVNILDASESGSEWRFAWSLGGGARYQLPNERMALRTDIRWMVTPVPSGDYATWCDAWGCYATGGTAWLHQGQVSAGLSIGF